MVTGTLNLFSAVEHVVTRWAAGHPVPDRLTPGGPARQHRWPWPDVAA